MNLVEHVEQSFLEPNSINSKIEEIRATIAEYERHDDGITLQKLRITYRFLLRFEQYYRKCIQKSDFLTSFRDFILFVGRIAVPNDILSLVKAEGEPFGLYVEGYNYINADISRTGWFIDDIFLRQVYGKDSVQSFKKKSSCGDALLYKATEFDSYRSFEQKIAVHTALQMPNGFTLLLSLSTGAGKSLLTQMMAACNDGLTVAIVPTVALGLDQFRAACSVLKKSISMEKIGCYCGEVKSDEKQKIYNGMEDGTLKLLITSPEAIVKNHKLKYSLYSVAERQKLSYLVIDETHIVQDWGGLFRPDFQMLSVIQKELLELSDKSLRTILLSATITEDATANLRKLFSTQENWIELRCDTLRTEPRYCIEKLNSQQILQSKVLHYARILPKPMIIYEIKPEKAEEWRKLLIQEGFNNIVSFTGDTNDVERTRIIIQWSQDKLDIVVATSAFGMGVDKPDVRTIIHTTLPESINRFYQEVGRGGRDGQPSLSILCYSAHDDEGVQQHIVNSRVITVEKMVDRWFSMLYRREVERDGDTVLLDTSTPPSKFSETEKENSGSQNMRWNTNILLFMMRYGLLEFIEMVFVPKQNCYFIRVRMLDIKIMQDSEKLSEVLEPLRTLELKSVTSGYQAMKEMTMKGNNACWANSFTEIFPNAPLACGGCPSHSNAYCNDDVFSLHNTVLWYSPNSKQIGTIKKLMGGLNTLLVVRNENEPWLVSKTLELAIKLNDLGIGVLVLPNTSDYNMNTYKGLVLNPNEFEFIAKHHPSVLSSGVLCAFDDNNRMNQKQYKCADYLNQYSIPVIYYCRENMFISQANRSIRHLLNAKKVTITEILEG